MVFTAHQILLGQSNREEWNRLAT